MPQRYAAAVQFARGRRWIAIKSGISVGKSDAIVDGNSRNA
jgi:hypothetical protein